MPSHEHDQQPEAGGPLEHEGLVRHWLARAADGDEDAWREIVGAYAKRVYGLLRSRGCDQGRAEEITQSVFVTVARVVGQGQYSEQGRFDAWLFRVAMNRLRDDARARKRRQMHELGDAAEAMPAASEPEAAPAEDFGSLRAALGGLSAADREVIELRHRADMSFNQIAELLGQPLGTVLARHHRALRKLRGVLEGAKQSTA
jgi:RNA polymerase sigma-70 factor (ECF subfamily)